MTTQLPISIGATPGNLRRSWSNVTCDPVGISYSNVVPPATVSVFNGTGVPPSFFVDPPTTNASLAYHALRLVKGLGTVNVGSDSAGRVNWTMDPNEVDVGDYVGFVIEDATGRVAVSELRTVYDGVKADSTCHFTGSASDDSVTPVAPARVGSWAGNVYQATPDYNCSAAYITYAVDSPPFTLSAFNASGLPSSFFTSLTTGDSLALGDSSTNVTILQEIATIAQSGGTYTWPVSLPVGTRFGWRVVDRNGVTGYSESRTVYASTAQTNQSAFCTRGLILDNPATWQGGGEGSTGLSYEAKRGLALGVTAAFVLVVAMWVAWRHKRKQKQAAAVAAVHAQSYEPNDDRSLQEISSPVSTAPAGFRAPRDDTPAMRSVGSAVMTRGRTRGASETGSLPIADLYTTGQRRYDGDGPSAGDGSSSSGGGGGGGGRPGRSSRRSRRRLADEEEQLPSYGEAVKSPPSHP